MKALGGVGGLTRANLGFYPAPPPWSATPSRFGGSGQGAYFALELEVILARSAIKGVDKPAAPGYYSSNKLISIQEMGENHHRSSI